MADRSDDIPSPQSGTITHQSHTEFKNQIGPISGISWSPSKIAAFDASRVQLVDHVPRAWERAPHLPAVEDSRFKTVWKCHSMRQQPLASTPVFAPVFGQKKNIRNTLSRSPQRPIKRMRVGLDVGIENSELFVKHDRSASIPYVVTSWEVSDHLLPSRFFLVCLRITARLITQGKHEHSSERTASETTDSQKDCCSSKPQAESSRGLSQTASVATPEHIETGSTHTTRSPESGTDIGVTEQRESAAKDFIEQDSSEQAEEMIARQNGDHATDANFRESLLDETISENASPVNVGENTLHVQASAHASPQDHETQHMAGTGAEYEAVDEITHSAAEASVDPNSIACGAEDAQTKSATGSVISGTISHDTNTPVKAQTSPQAPQAPQSPKIHATQVEEPFTQCSIDDGLTATLTSQHYLDEEKAYLESFLDRAAASKASKTLAVAEDDESCTDREHAQNRRDSDAIRQALASPVRLALEDKDGNVFSPLKQIERVKGDGQPAMKTTSATAMPELVLPPIDDLLAVQNGESQPRRSVRSRSNRSAEAAPGLSTGPHQINIRRTDPTETLTLALNKSEAQKTALDTRKNTRKNKGTALGVQDRLLKWQAELVVLGKDGSILEPRVGGRGSRGVRWSESLEFLNEATGKPEQAPLVNNEQAPTVKQADSIEETNGSGDATNSTPVKKPKNRSTRSATSKGRRLQTASSKNIIPSKTDLSRSLVADEMHDDQQMSKPELAVTDGEDDVTSNHDVPSTAMPTSKIGRVRIGSASAESAVPLAHVAQTEGKTPKSKLQPPKKVLLGTIAKSVTPGDAPPSKIKPPSIKKPSMLPVAGSQPKKAVRKI